MSVPTKKYELSESQRRTVHSLLSFLHREYDSRIKTGANGFDVAACNVARAEICDLLEIFE